jgi:hypothetical protein
MNQKFNRGDLVYINSSSKDGFTGLKGDCEGIIEYSYADKHGGSDKRYCVFIRGQGKIAWYDEERLTFVESERFDLLGEWTADLEAAQNSFQSLHLLSITLNGISIS